MGCKILLVFVMAIFVLGTLAAPVKKKSKDDDCTELTKAVSKVIDKMVEDDPTFDADAFLAYVIQKLENMDDLEDTGKFNSIVKEFPGLQ